MAVEPKHPASPRNDRIPPNSEEAERGVLGCAMLEAQRVVDLAVERGIRPNAFYVPAHQELFELLLEMISENRPVDLLTVTERLRVSNKLEKLGGIAFLEKIMDSTPTSAHAEYYIDIVRQKQILRNIIDCSREAQEACYGAEEDAALILGKAEQAFFDVTELEKAAARPWGDLVQEEMEEIEHIFQTRKGISGVATGFHDLDGILFGLHPSDMIILAARPSMGKTSLALNITEKVALGEASSDQEPLPVAVFSLEMSSEQLVRRMICSRAEVSSSTLMGGKYLSKEHHGNLTQAASVLRKAKIVIDDSAGLEVLELRSRARRLKRKHDIRLIVVDYLQLLNYPQFAKEGRQRETAAISGALKAMAKELKVPVLVLSQLSRAPEKTSSDRIRKPRLSDLRDSGAIEQDADVVLMLRRPEEGEEDDKLAIVQIEKHRNGQTGEIELNFEKELTRFQNRARPGVDAHAEYSPGYGGES